METIERATDQVKKKAKEEVPTDLAKDAAGLARKLRWTVRLAAGYESTGAQLAIVDTSLFRAFKFSNSALFALQKSCIVI
jgi:hypothetical protein